MVVDVDFFVSSLFIIRRNAFRNEFRHGKVTLDLVPGTQKSVFVKGWHSIELRTSPKWWHLSMTQNNSGNKYYRNSQHDLDNKTTVLALKNFQTIQLRSSSLARKVLASPVKRRWLKQWNNLIIEFIRFLWIFSLVVGDLTVQFSWCSVLFYNFKWFQTCSF